MRGTARSRIRHVALTAITMLAFGQAACELEDDDCSAAKAHLCSKLYQKACSSSWMGDAVERLRGACEQVEADRFIPAAEAYGRATTDCEVDACQER